MGREPLPVMRQPVLVAQNGGQACLRRHASPCACDSPCVPVRPPCVTHTHAQIPDYLKIDYDEPLLGSVKSYGRHVLFQTGPGRTPRNWPTKLEEEKASLAMEVGHARTQPHQTHAHPPTLGGRTHCMSGCTRQGLGAYAFIDMKYLFLRLISCDTTYCFWAPLLLVLIPKPNPRVRHCFH